LKDWTQLVLVSISFPLKKKKIKFQPVLHKKQMNSSIVYLGNRSLVLDAATARLHFITVAPPPQLNRFLSAFFEGRDHFYTPLWNPAHTPTRLRTCIAISVLLFHLLSRSSRLANETIKNPDSNLF
jgi:hypothetical protein